MEIARVGIIGAGTMGSGIAMALAQHGCTVTLIDQKPDTAAAAVDAAALFFARQSEKRRLSSAEAAAAAARVSSATHVGALSEVDLAIEAVFEDFDLKLRVLSEVADALRPDAIIATNTSCLRVSELARAVPRPQRFLGLHYFSPAQVNPIVEVVRGEQTTSTVADRAATFCSRTGKIPILCKDQYGFAINRFFCPYTNEAVRVLDEGLASTAAIDRIARDALGAAAGPFLVMNLIKPRINLHAIRNLAPLGGFYAPAASMETTGDADRSWPIEEAPELDHERTQIVTDRLRAGTFLPVLQELDEAVAEPSAIDLGAREALKFAKPPCEQMDQLGRGEVERILDPILRRYDLEPPRSLARVGTFTQNT